MYDILDSLIISAIESGKCPLYNGEVLEEACRIGRLTGREAMRVQDGRIQSLRKAGKICHVTKRESPNGRAGWRLTK